MIPYKQASLHYACTRASTSSSSSIIPAATNAAPVGNIHALELTGAFTAAQAHAHVHTHDRHVNMTSFPHACTQRTYTTLGWRSCVPHVPPVHKKRRNGPDPGHSEARRNDCRRTSAVMLVHSHTRQTPFPDELKHSPDPQTQHSYLIVTLYSRFDLTD